MGCLVPGGDQLLGRARGDRDGGKITGTESIAWATKNEGSGALILPTAVNGFAWSVVLQQSAGLPVWWHAWCPFLQHAICALGVDIAPSAQIAQSDQLRVAARAKAIKRTALVRIPIDVPFVAPRRITVHSPATTCPSTALARPCGLFR